MTLLVQCLAAYRLTVLLYAEDGPAKLIKHAREWIDTTPAADLSPLHCPLCTSVWVALCVVLCDKITGNNRSSWLRDALAVSAAVVIAYQLFPIHPVLEETKT